MFANDNQRFIAFQKLYSDAHEPSYANEGDAGLDLRALLPATIHVGEQAYIKTGIAMAIPRHSVGLVSPRSGLAKNHGVTVLNAPGIIDSGYRGEIGVILVNHGWQPFQIEPGDKIAQLVIVPFYRAILGERNVSEDVTERGQGGFGSSDLD